MKKAIITTILSFVFISSSMSQTIEDAKKLTENEQYEAASAIYQALLTKNPSDAAAYYFFGDNLLLSDNPDSARIIFDKGLAIDASNPLLKIGKARILLNSIGLKESKISSEKDGSNKELRDRYEQAQANVKEANVLIDGVSTSTKDLTVLIEAAEALLQFKNKDTQKAQVLLDKAAAIDSKNYEINILYGDLYKELNNGTLSADYYNKAYELNKKSARAIVSKGVLYKRSTNYDGAVREFEDAIKIDSNYAPAHRELAEVYLKLSKLDKGIVEYKKYLDISKNNNTARIRYASFLYASKSYAEALNELNPVQQRGDTNNVTMLRIQTYCYYETKDYVKGLEVVNHLFRVLPIQSRAASDYEYYGKLLIASNQDSLGIEQLMKAIALEPARVDLLTEVANAWYKISQYPNAIQMMKQKMALSKESKSADYFILGKAYYYNKQFSEADSALAKVTEISSTYASGWLWRAKVNTQIDSTSELGLAKPFYEKYIELAMADSLNPTKYQQGLIDAYTYIAYYYSLKNQNQEALIYLKKKLELPLEPNDKSGVLKGIDQIEHPAPNPKPKK